MKIIEQRIVNGCSVIEFDPGGIYETPLCLHVNADGRQLPLQYFNASDGQTMHVELPDLDQGSSACILCFYEKDRLVYRYVTRCVHYTEDTLKEDPEVDLNIIAGKAKQMFQRVEVNDHVTA